MKSEVGKKSDLKNGHHTLRLLIALIVIVAVVISIFINLYRSYTDDILYEERLEQMKSVTSQLFTGLEDVVDSQWYIAQTQVSRLEKTELSTVDQFIEFMKEQADIGKFDSLKAEMIAVDNYGRFYTEKGQQGLFQELDYLEDQPEQVSFAADSVTKDRTSMLFLCHLSNPVTINDGENIVTLNYYGISREMTELDQYFNCAVYEGQSSVYVLDESGIKLFTGTNNSNAIKGLNVYKVLQNMDYLHDADFDSVLKELRVNGNTYSNALLDGEEVYYTLYQMKNAAWTLLFMVPSEFVAVNTVQLVDSTTQIVLIFAIIMLMICIVIIYWMLRRQQKRELLAAEQNNVRLLSMNELLDEKNRILESTNQELEIAQNEAVQARKTAENASKAKGDFLSNMSHDIRTPMNAIVGITNLMKHEENNPEKLDAYINKLQTSSRHLLSLINDVLDMSKIESSDVTLNAEQINLAEQISQIDTIIRPQAEGKNQSFVIRIHDIEHEFLIGDGVRIRQVVINLLSNAVKYTADGGTITFDLAELPCDESGRARFSIAVTDNGYGMTPEFLEHIFEPFVRAENSTTNKVQGTGLGMAITKKIVDLMNGTLTVQSEPGKGSRFEAILPIEVNKDVDCYLKVGSILLICDEDVMLENVTVSLRKSDAVLHTVRTKEEAEAVLRNETIDVVLLCNCINDPLLADNVKKLRSASKEKVLIFCCDYSDPEKVYDLLNKSGADGLVQRPFFLSNFAKVIDSVNEKQDKTSESNPLKGKRFLCAEDNELNAEILTAILEMDGAECTIYHNGKEIVDAFLDVKPGEYDAILMDVQMPVMNGLEAAKEIRVSDNPLGRTIPIIAMTANAFSSDVQACLDAGMNAHVSKPLDIKALAGTIKSLQTDIFLGGGVDCPPVTEGTE